MISRGWPPFTARSVSTSGKAQASLGVDHAVISVRDVAASRRFYAPHGLSEAGATGRRNARCARRPRWRPGRRRADEPPDRSHRAFCWLQGRAAGRRVWTPQKMQVKSYFGRACGRVRTCVRPRKATSTSTRRGPLWNSWIGSNSATRALGTRRPNDSSDLVSDRLPIILR